MTNEKIFDQCYQRKMRGTKGKADAGALAHFKADKSSLYKAIMQAMDAARKDEMIILSKQIELIFHQVNE